MSIPYSYCFDGLKSVGGIDLNALGLYKFPPGGVYGSSNGWLNPPMVDANGWLCASDGNGVSEHRGQWLTTFVPDKTKVYWVGARFRNLPNNVPAIFRFTSNASNFYEPLMGNNVALALPGGTGIPEVFIELEINYPANLLRYFKDGVMFLEESFNLTQGRWYINWGAATPMHFGVPFKNVNSWSADGSNQMKVRDILMVIGDGVGHSTRTGPVNIRRAPIIISDLTGYSRDKFNSQNTLNRVITNTAGAQWTASQITKVNATPNRLTFKLDLSAIPGKKLAAGILVAARRVATVIPTMEVSQTVAGTQYTDTGVLTMANMNQNYAAFTPPRAEFAAANVDLATVDFTLTLKEPV